MVGDCHKDDQDPERCWRDIFRRAMPSRARTGVRQGGSFVEAAAVIEGTWRDGGLRRTDARSWLEAEAPISPLGREFLAYWHEKCPEGGFPSRADISPTDMVRLLPYIFMLDVLEQEGELDFRFRLVGTAIMRVEGEHTGKLLSEMFPNREAYSVLWQQYRDAATGKVWVRHETLRWQGRDHIDYEVILAPLQDETGRVTMLIGIAHAQNEN